MLRSLTETSKVASEQLLNRDFERHFTEECKILRAPVLRAPAVTLQFPGRQGQVTRKKAVASGEHRPSDVLSEGEQKVIALADFLAETPAPVIFDDPINSLHLEAASPRFRIFVGIVNFGIYKHSSFRLGEILLKHIADRGKVSQKALSQFSFVSSAVWDVRTISYTSSNL